jgi:hypothetical protein
LQDAPAELKRSQLNPVARSKSRLPLLPELLQSAANQARVSGNHEHRRKYNHVVHFESPFPLSFALRRSSGSPPFGFGCAKIVRPSLSSARRVAFDLRPSVEQETHKVSQALRSGATPIAATSKHDSTDFGRSEVARAA